MSTAASSADRPSADASSPQQRAAVHDPSLQDSGYGGGTAVMSQQNSDGESATRESLGSVTDETHTGPFAFRDLARIDEALPPGAAAGTRYAAPLMAALDSERPAA